jgi:hypothetical protein
MPSVIMVNAVMLSDIMFNVIISSFSMLTSLIGENVVVPISIFGDFAKMVLFGIPI